MMMMMMMVPYSGGLRSSHALPACGVAVWMCATTQSLNLRSVIIVGTNIFILTTPGFCTVELENNNVCQLRDLRGSFQSKLTSANLELDAWRRTLQGTNLLSTTKAGLHSQLGIANCKFDHKINIELHRNLNFQLLLFVDHGLPLRWNIVSPHAACPLLVCADPLAVSAAIEQLQGVHRKLRNEVRTTKRRENTVLLKVMEGRQRLCEVEGEMKELRQSHHPSNLIGRKLLLDPAIHAEFSFLKVPLTLSSSHPLTLSPSHPL